jgi:hypothetical protein
MVALFPLSSATLPISPAVGGTQPSPLGSYQTPEQLIQSHPGNSDPELVVCIWHWELLLLGHWISTSAPWVCVGA